MTISGVTWMACEQPERPPDPLVVWHYICDGDVCRGCSLKAGVQLRRFPDDPHVRWLAGMVDPTLDTGS